MRFKKNELLYLMKKYNIPFNDFCKLVGKNEMETKEIIEGGLITDRAVAEVIIKRFGALNSIFAIDWEGSGIEQPDFETIFKGGCQKYAY